MQLGQHAHAVRPSRNGRCPRVCVLLAISCAIGTTAASSRQCASFPDEQPIWKRASPPPLAAHTSVLAVRWARDAVWRA